MGWPWNNSSTIWFRIRACVIAARRTPAASYITTSANASAMANGVERTPSRKPTAVASPATVAECELGMPPIVTSQRRFTRRSRME